MTPTLSIFASPSGEGMSLAEAAQALGRKLGYTTEVVHPMLIERATLCDTAVVFDGSVDVPTKAYRYSGLPPTLFEHVLVVSRTWLPLNFRSRSVCAPRYPETQRNDDILPWLERQLERLREHPGWRLPRERYFDVEARATAVANIAESIGSDPEKLPGGVFVSYRARYDRDAASELVRRINAGEFAEARWAKMLAPGELTADNEVLSEGRSWMIVTLLDEALSSCDELWICHSEHYLSSWWTVAELFLAQCLRRRVRLYDAATGRLSDPPPEYCPAISDELLDRFSTLTTNARPDSVAPEARPVKLLEKVLFRVGLGERFLRFQRRVLADEEAQRMFFAGLPDEDRRESAAKLLGELENVDGYREFVNHRAFTRAWWDELCVDPADGATARTELLDPAAFVESLRSLPRLHIRKARRAARRGERVQTSRRTWVSLREAPPRYLWRPRSQMVLMGGLERLDTFINADRL